MDEGLLNEVPKPEIFVCSVCQCESSYGEAFKYSSQGIMCPRCFNEAEIKSLSKKYKSIFLVVAFSALFAIVLYLFDSRLHYLFANVFLAMLLWYCTIVLYGLTQAGAGLLTGGKVYSLEIGSGPDFYKKQIGRCHFSLRKFPEGSSYCVGYPELGFVKLRMAIFYASGIVVHSILIILLLPNFELSNMATTYAFSEIFLLTNVYMLFGIVVPQDLKLGGKQVTNNAYSLKRILNGETELDAIHSSYLYFEGSYALSNEDYKEAQKICETGMNRYPKEVIFKIILARSLEKQEQKDKALQLLEEVISSFTITVPQRALALNNASWNMLLSKVNLNKAYIYAQEAFSLMPWAPSFEGTLGSVFIETDNIEQGIYHVMQAYEHHPICSNKATNIAYAAIGYHRLGDNHQAKEYLAKALTIDANADSVREAQMELGEVHT